MPPPKINVSDFKNWCLQEKGISDITNAPFDIWLLCINEYCNVFYKR